MFRPSIQQGRPGLVWGWKEKGHGCSRRLITGLPMALLQKKMHNVVGAFLVLPLMFKVTDTFETAHYSPSADACLPKVLMILATVNTEEVSLSLIPS